MHTTSHVNIVVSSVFAVFTLAYAWVLFAGAGFGMVDDHILYNHAYWTGHFYLPMNAPLGRFFPANGLEFSVLRAAGVTDPSVYSSLMAFKFLATALLAHLLLKSRGLGGSRNLAVVALLLLTPGVAGAYSRKFVSESDMLPLIMALGLLLPRAQALSWGRFTACLGLGTALLYYKEPFGPTLAAMACLGIWACRGQGRPAGRVAALYAGLLLSALVWAVVYYCVVYRFKAADDYSVISARHSLGQLFRLYVLNDPLLFAGLVWLGASRLRGHLRGTSTTHWVEPSESAAGLPAVRWDMPAASGDEILLVGAFVYVAVFLGLGIYAPYYLLPAYGLMLPALAGTLARLRWAPTVYTRLAMVLAALLVVNMLAATAAVLSHSVYSQMHVQAFGTFLGDYAAMAPKRPIRITFLGAPPDGEIPLSVSALLAHLHLESAYQPVFQTVEKPYRRLYAPDAVSADLLVVTPHAVLSEWELASMVQSMPCLFSTHSPWFTQEYSVQAYWLKLAGSGMDALLFAAQREHLQSDFMVFAVTEAGREAFRPFDVAKLNIEALDVPATASPWQASALRVRVTNASDRAWNARSDAQGGSIRLVSMVTPPSGGTILCGSAAMPERLAPGASVEVDVPFTPPVRNSRQIVVVIAGKMSENGVLFLQPSFPLTTTVKVDAWMFGER